MRKVRRRCFSQKNKKRKNFLWLFQLAKMQMGDVEKTQGVKGLTPLRCCALDTLRIWDSALFFKTSFVKILLRER